MKLVNNVSRFCFKIIAIKYLYLFLFSIDEDVYLFSNESNDLNNMLWSMLFLMLLFELLQRLNMILLFPGVIILIPLMIIYD